MKKSEQYDVAVIGLGAMGSAALYHLSQMGVRVIGIDQYNPPHTFGSTHGDTRITRLAVGEGSEYVPLVTRAHSLWRELEKKAGAEIFTQCGGIVLASEDNPFLKQTISSAEEYSIDHELLSAKQIHNKYPMFAVSDNTMACYEPTAGYVVPERAVSAHLLLAKEAGADILLDTKVVSLEEGTVEIEQGRIKTNKIIVSAGAWAKELLPETKDVLRVYRQLLYWFPVKNNYEQFTKMPIFIWEFGETEDDFIYGFPAINGREGGIKVATEEYNQEVSANIGKKPASDSEIEKMYSNYIAPNLPGLGSNAIRTASCLYTNTEDSRFLIDEISQGIWLVSPCSGHGFKHSAAIGEAVAQQVTEGSSDISLDFFKYRDK